jgi:hypothetical protein
VTARCGASMATCPACGCPTARVHSWYEHLPLSGRHVVLRVRLRRFRCQAAACQRRTFGEPIPALAPRYARRTVRLRAELEVIGLMVGGPPEALGGLARVDDLRRVDADQAQSVGAVRPSSDATSAVSPSKTRNWLGRVAARSSSSDTPAAAPAFDEPYVADRRTTRIRRVARCAYPRARTSCWATTAQRRLPTSVGSSRARTWSG